MTFYFRGSLRGGSPHPLETDLSRIYPGFIRDLSDQRSPPYPSSLIVQSLEELQSEELEVSSPLDELELADSTLKPLEPELPILDPDDSSWLSLEEFSELSTCAPSEVMFFRINLKF